MGSERSTPEIKSEPVSAPRPPHPPLPSYQHESLQCFQCFITFSDPKAKERHMRKSHREQYKKQLQHTNTVFTCYNCDKCFYSSEELSEHTATHRNDEKCFQCPFCKETFLTFTEQTKHRRWDCVERQCPCKDCGALFPNPSRLQYHRISVHLHPPLPILNQTVDTYQCCKCSRYFQSENELLLHQEKFANSTNCNLKPGKPGKKRGRKPKIEDVEVPIKITKIKQEEEEMGQFNDIPTGGCSSQEQQLELKIPCSEADCDLIFPSLAALRAHKKVRHGRLPRKAHACTECDESYARPEQLSVHIARAHCSSRYKCPTCGKSFPRESVLKTHLTTHSQEEEEEEDDTR